MKIVIDPGHGGQDPGAVYRGRVDIDTDDIAEADVAWDLAEEIAAALQADGHNIWFTRSRDQYISPRARAHMANQVRADLLISVHINASTDPMANGVEIIVDERSADSRDVASYILVAIGRDCTVRVRGIKLDCETPPKHLTVLEAANMPAVLIEAGFISHASDLDYVLDHGREIAQAVADGVEAWSQNEVAI